MCCKSDHQGARHQLLDTHPKGVSREEGTQAAAGKSDTAQNQEATGNERGAQNGDLQGNRTALGIG